MFKPTFDDADQIEPVLSLDYAVAFPDFPLLGYLVADVNLPGWTVDSVRLEMWGKSREFAGRNVSSHSLEMVLLYDRKSRAFRTLYGLLQATVDSKTGNRTLRPFSIIVEHYDSIGVMVHQRVFSNCWVKNLGGFTLAADNEDKVLQPVEFGYEKQDIVFGATAIAEPQIPVRDVSLLGSDPRDVIAAYTQKLATTPATIMDIFRSGLEAIAYGKAVASQISSLAKATLSQAKTNPLGAIRSASSLVTQTKNALKTFF